MVIVVSGHGWGGNGLQALSGQFVCLPLLVTCCGTMPEKIFASLGNQSVRRSELSMEHEPTRSDMLLRMQQGEERLRSLLLQGLAGDARAYQVCLTDMGAHLRAFFKRRLTSLPHEVEDLVQETLLALHNQRHTYQREQPLTAWVHAIARYKMIDLFRSRGRRDALNDSLDDEMQLFAASQTEACDARRDLGRLLEQLPDHQRLPIVHMKLEGLSVIETAKATGMSESAVKVGVHRGLKALAALVGASP
jgi:RNA polymerase sigma factor (sigma-70 family)